MYGIMMNKDYGFATKAIHAGHAEDPNGALTAPIYQTSTFCFDTAEQGGRRFAGEESGYIYSRLGNPTVASVEEKMAQLENGEGAVAFSSGMGAISSTLWTALKAGDHVVADETLYGCTFALLTHGLTRYGVEVTMVDTTDEAALKAAFKPNTKVCYFETPANPNLKVVDIKKVADIAHAHNPEIRVICDNTFSTPYLQRPLELGCDVVVHSATKYLNGHGDVIAGFMIAADAAFAGEVRMFGLKDMTGSVLGPFEAFLIGRGLKTLKIRMEEHCKNAMEVAKMLDDHPAVSRVYYPGLPNDPYHDVAKKQMSHFGGMISFELTGGYAAGIKMLDSVKLLNVAVSLGDTETLIQHPASMTHSTYTPDERAAAGIAEGLVRLSVGLENVEDIKADLDQALNAASR